MCKAGLSAVIYAVLGQIALPGRGTRRTHTHLDASLWQALEQKYMMIFVYLEAGNARVRKYNRTQKTGKPSKTKMPQKVVKV